MLNKAVSKAAAKLSLRGGWDDANCAQRSHSTAHPLADIFHPPYPPIASQSISRDVPFARARPSTPYTSLKGSGRGCPLLRASNEHRFTVRVLRARRAPGRSLLILLRPRVARARGSSQPPCHLFQHPANLRRGRRAYPHSGGSRHPGHSRCPARYVWDPCRTLRWDLREG